MQLLALAWKHRWLPRGQEGESGARSCTRVRFYRIAQGTAFASIKRTFNVHKILRLSSRSSLGPGAREGPVETGRGMTVLSDSGTAAKL